MSKDPGKDPTLRQLSALCAKSTPNSTLSVHYGPGRAVRLQWISLHTPPTMLVESAGVTEKAAIAGFLQTAKEKGLGIS